MKKLSFFILALVLFSSCSNVMITGRRQLNLVSDSTIVSQSAIAYKQFIDSVPKSKDLANTALVRKVGVNIANAVENYMKNNGFQNDLQYLKWEFNLVKDTVVNAFCMPGGKVVFFDGILPVTKTESGIAVVMGHEIAHAVAKHSSERLSQQMALQTGGQLTAVLFSTKSEAVLASIQTIYGIGAQVGVLLPYSRKQEYEADRLGLIFMAMAGYDPNEAVAFWERMAASSKGLNIEILSTHPLDENRIAQMKVCLPEAMQYFKR